MALCHATLSNYAPKCGNILQRASLHSLQVSPMCVCQCVCVFVCVLADGLANANSGKKACTLSTLLGSRINGCDCNGALLPSTDPTKPRQRPRQQAQCLPAFLLSSPLFLPLSVSLSLALCHCLAIMQRVLIMTTAAREEATTAKGNFKRKRARMQPCGFYS